LTGTCDTKFCSGKKVTEDCKVHDDCVVGNWCDPKAKKCAAIKAANAACESKYECSMDSVCFQKKCTKLYSLAAQAVFDTKTDFPATELVSSDEMCSTLKSTSLKSGKTQCINTDYYKPTGLIKTDFIKCNFQADCLYQYDDTETKAKGNITQTCGCGYSTSGQGYCPLPTSRKSADWKAYIDAKLALYTQPASCHTKRRSGQCLLKTKANTDKLSKPLKTLNEFYGSKLLTAHQFVDSDKCHLEILSSGIFKFSFISIVAIISFLF